MWPGSRPSALKIQRPWGGSGAALGARVESVLPFRLVWGAQKVKDRSPHSVDLRVALAPLCAAHSFPSAKSQVPLGSFVDGSLIRVYGKFCHLVAEHSPLIIFWLPSFCGVLLVVWEPAPDRSVYPIVSY